MGNCNRIFFGSTTPKFIAIIQYNVGLLVIHSASLPPTNVQGADKSLSRPASRCILFDGEHISFDASLVIYIYIYK